MAFSAGRKTALVPHGIPGQVPSFTAKTEAVPTGPPVGTLMTLGVGR